MIPPTVGRVVLYRPGNGETWPALICYVWSDRLVNVAGFNANGEPFKHTSLPLVQDEDPAPQAGSPYAEWMPYQKGQAAKTEALEKVVQQGYQNLGPAK